FDESDAIEHVIEAKEANESDTSNELKLLYAQIQSAWQIADGAAQYFRFRDGEEEVDKSMVAESYRKLAKDLQADYDKEQGRTIGNGFRIMTRADRPRTTPPTGESGQS